MVDWCDHGYRMRFDLSKGQRVAFLSLDLVLIPITLVCNLTLLYTLTKTKLYRKISNFFIFGLCISDTCFALVVQPLVAVLLIRYPDQDACIFATIIQFLLFFNGHLSVLLIVAVSVDRFLHMRFLNNYNLFMTPRRGRIMILVAVIIALSIAIGYTVATALQVYIIFNGVVLIIDGIFSTLILLLYMWTFWRIHRHVSDTPHLQSKTEEKARSSLGMAKIVLLILTAVTICYTPYIVVNLIMSYQVAIQGKWPRNVTVAAMYFSYVLVYVNSMLNAVIFMTGNKKCLEFIRRRARSLLKAEDYAVQKEEAMTQSTSL
uniref:Biogenic amine-like GPCR n=1 Tax=Tripedalia cystophora TaxID=6141 RepID=A0A481ZLH1_TRICY|nr:biogenic amine-like GPCR [Tripedalia cystophora]